MFTIVSFQTRKGHILMLSSKNLVGKKDRPVYGVDLLFVSNFETGGGYDAGSSGEGLGFGFGGV
jgi:hypothetical protein